jgi:hypothetical protein
MLRWGGAVIRNSNRNGSPKRKNSNTKHTLEQKIIISRIRYAHRTLLLYNSNQITPPPQQITLKNVKKLYKSHTQET